MIYLDVTCITVFFRHLEVQCYYRLKTNLSYDKGDGYCFRTLTEHSAYWKYISRKDGELFKKNNSYLLTPEVGAPVIPFADFHQ